MHEVAQSIATESRVVYVDNDRCKSGCVHACCLVPSSPSRPLRADARGAIALHEQSAADYARVFGTGHSETSTARSNLPTLTSW